MEISFLKTMSNGFADNDNDPAEKRLCFLNTAASSSAGAAERFNNLSTVRESDGDEEMKGEGQMSCEKSSVLNGDGDKMSVRKERCPSYGMMAIMGRREEMEDAVAAVPSFFKGPSSSSSSSALHFFGVYDGHGGAQASGFCRERLHEALAEELRALPDDCRRDYSDWDKVMKNCFVKMDMQLGGLCPSGKCCHNDENKVDIYSTCCRDLVAPENVGSTAVVAVVSSSQIVVANCGDSRAVLCRGGKAVPFSTDHKPEREDEMDRIEAAGGRIIDWNGYRVGGLLAMSRALGDRFLKQYVISEPEVTFTERKDDDEFLILASDGLWDVLSNEGACEVASKCLAGYRPSRLKGTAATSSVAFAAAVLTKVALARGSNDNISVVVIDLKDNRKLSRKNRCTHSLKIHTNL